MIRGPGKGVRVSNTIPQRLARNKRRIRDRLAKAKREHLDKPAFRASNNHDELAERNDDADAERYEDSDGRDAPPSRGTRVLQGVADVRHANYNQSHRSSAAVRSCANAGDSPTIHSNRSTPMKSPEPATNGQRNGETFDPLVEAKALREAQLRFCMRRHVECGVAGAADGERGVSCPLVNRGEWPDCRFRWNRYHPVRLGDLRLKSGPESNEPICHYNSDTQYPSMQ
ncbi:hypothetical protein BH11PLA2_BH11PLA2_02810 [soil metagenome]